MNGTLKKIKENLGVIMTIIAFLGVIVGGTVAWTKLNMNIETHAGSISDLKKIDEELANVDKTMDEKVNQAIISQSNATQEIKFNLKRLLGPNYIELKN